jgi:hypothetical protein
VVELHWRSLADPADRGKVVATRARAEAIISAYLDRLWPRFDFWIVPLDWK